MTAIQKAPNHPLIASDRIEGTLVRRHNGEKIGKIERLMIDKAIKGEADFWKLPIDQPMSGAQALEIISGS